MNRLVLALLTFAIATSVAAQTKATTDPVLDFSLPNCSESTLKFEPFEGRLPSGMTADVFELDSSDPTCHADGVRFRTGDGRVWVGNPWPIFTKQGTPAEKIKTIAWDALQKTVVVEAGAMEGGFQKVRVYHVIEGGRFPVDGLVDPAGTYFFQGEFARDGADAKARFDARLAPVIAASPARGPKDAPVTIIEFSDFQCPSCKRGAEALEPFIEANAGKIRHIRIDMPIISMHPWAYPASVIGRAIWRQSPEVFWKYKSLVYASQADLTSFQIDQFGRDFAEDHGLDMKRYDEDVASEAVQKEILASVGAAFTLNVLATPTYFVNGKIVATGPESAHLKSYVEKLLAAK